MDIKKSPLEEKISKLAEHGESLEKSIIKEGKDGTKERRFENEQRIVGAETSKLGSISVSSSSGKTQSQAVVKTAKDLQGLDKENQVKSLVKLSFTKGVFFAVDVAKKLDDPYILDELHDALVKQFKELIKNKKIKEV